MISARVAVILSGSGVYDGTELTEGASSIIHLSRCNADVTIFAPDKPQMHVINHLTGEEMKGETRNVLVESARLARGKVEPLSSCVAANFDALVIPGGFGAAKNLSTFAVDGLNLSVDPDVERVVKDFHKSKKVIGMSCIAPVIAAKLIPGVKITMGKEQESETYPFAGAVAASKAMGAMHVESEPTEAVTCYDNLVVTSGAYMYQGEPHVIYDSVKAMVDGVLDLVEKTKGA